MTNIFPDDPTKVAKVLSELFRHQNMEQIAMVLDIGTASLEQAEYDNYNGGTYGYALMIKVPIRTFASIEPQLGTIEKTIKEKAQTAFRVPNHYISTIVISPDGESVGPPQPKAEDEDIKRIWGDKPTRLFISHVSAHKIFMGPLKAYLDGYGISAFVAHEDIEPTLVWQNEIEKALQSMHALAAILTSDFHESRWTDQEIGMALGRGIPVIPVRVSADPYGFIGKHQGFTASFADLPTFADGLADILLNLDMTKKQMRNGLIPAFENALSFDMSKRLISKIEKFGLISDIELRRMELACEANDQISKSWGVSDRVKALRQKVSEIPF